LTRRTPRKTKAVIQWLKRNVRYVPKGDLRVWKVCCVDRLNPQPFAGI
jgi:hypothetical protein